MRSVLSKKNIISVGFNDVLRQLNKIFSFGLFCMPQRVEIRLTHRCNLTCRHCLHPRATKELNTQEWKTVILGLKKWLGRFPLSISGGEPLLRTDLFEIIKFSHDLGLVTMLNSNGSLVNKEVVDKLEGSGIDVVALSLDGFKEKTHDYLRGAGVYEKTMNAVFCLKGRIRTQINTVITEQNFDELLDLIDFSERNNLGLCLMGLLCNGYNGKNISAILNNEFLPKGKDRISRQFDRIIERKKKSPHIRSPLRYLRGLKSYYLGMDNSFWRCRAYNNVLTILPDGTVKTCWLLAPIGNIMFTEIKAIYYSKEAGLRRREIKKCRLNCSFSHRFFQENLFEKLNRCVNTFFN